MSALKLALNFQLNFRYSMVSSLPAGPKIFIVNHPTIYDLFPIMAVAPDRIHSLIEWRSWTNTVPRTLFRMIKQIEVFPGLGAEALKSAREYLEEGDSVLIAPEGVADKDDIWSSDRPKPASGFTRLALATGAPIIPVGIWLKREDLVPVTLKFKKIDINVNTYRPRFRAKYHCLFGEPIYLDGSEELINDKNEIRKLTNEVFSQVYLLSEKSESI